MSFETVIGNILNGILSPLVALIIGAALALFLYGLASYLKAGLGDEKTIESARGMMVWGVIIIFVMVSVWGLVQVLQNLFFGGQSLTEPPTVPCFQGENCPSGGAPSLNAGDNDGNFNNDPNSDLEINREADDSESNDDYFNNDVNDDLEINREDDQGNNPYGDYSD